MNRAHSVSVMTVAQDWRCRISSRSPGLCHLIYTSSNIRRQLSHALLWQIVGDNRVPYPHSKRKSLIRDWDRILIGNDAVVKWNNCHYLVYVQKEELETFLIKFEPSIDSINQSSGDIVLEKLPKLLTPSFKQAWYLRCNTAENMIHWFLHETQSSCDMWTSAKETD